jgi:hypothetical protein
MATSRFGEFYLVAVVSLILYAALLGITIQQYYVISQRRVGKFNNFKLIFLVILGVSAALSLPLWGACVILGGPHDCQWESKTYLFCWSLHLLALVGYSTAIGIPTLMWSDIVNGVDHHTSILKSFSSSHIDSTRICFVTFVSSYALLELTSIISMAVDMSPHHMGSYYNHNPIYLLSILLEPFIICLFAGGCLLIGIRLQLYVRSVRFDQFTQSRLLWQLNGVLAIVAICYMLRALLIFDLRVPFLSIHLPYVGWIACTHWAPQVICSFCLLTVMCRSKGSENASGSSMKYQAFDNTTDGFRSPNDFSASPLLLSEEEDDDFPTERDDGEDEHASTEHEFFYPQEGERQGSFSEQHSSNQRRGRSMSSGSRHSQLQHDFSLFNPYLMASDDGNDSVVSDDIQPMHTSIRNGIHEFGNSLLDF